MRKWRFRLSRKVIVINLVGVGLYCAFLAGVLPAVVVLIVLAPLAVIATFDVLGIK